MTPQFGGFYRVNVSRPDGAPIKDRDTLAAVCTQLNNTPVTDYPMAFLNYVKGFEQWLAVMVDDAKGDYIALVADDHDRYAERQLEMERTAHAGADDVLEGLATLLGAEEDADSPKKPRTVADLTDFDKIKMMMDAGETMEAAMRMLSRVEDEWYEGRLRSADAESEPEGPISILRNDLSDLRAEFTGDDDAFAAFVTERFSQKPPVNSINMVWKGRGQKNPFEDGPGSPFGTVVV